MTGPYLSITLIKQAALGLRRSAGLFTLTPSPPAFPNYCCLKGPVPYWSNPPFLIFDIWALWGSGLSARVPECPKLKTVG